MAQTKGWVGDAAAEIVKRASDDLRKLDTRLIEIDIGIEVVQSIIQKHYTAKLARGPLGTGEGATMPVPRCDNCAHWSRQSGICNKLTTESTLFVAAPSFGCVEFKA